MNNLNENLSASALRFAKANAGIYFEEPKQIKTKTDMTKEKATRERPLTKLNQSKILCEEFKHETRRIMIEILMDRLQLSYATASVYACTCAKLQNSG